MKSNSRGVQFNDRVLAGEVRTLTLNECRKHLKKGKGRMYEIVLNNLSRSVLPRLSEVTGEGGEPLKIEISEAIAKKYAFNSGTNNNS